jgi:8-oxo-dGTP pyrophosphatase MutT (NUDIX family)
MSDIQPWEEVRREYGVDLIIARQRTDHLRHPKSGGVFARTILEVPDWVNVVARTPASEAHPSGELVVVRQWRFGRESVSVEIPGGVIDPGEDHETAAKRELREETGYTSSKWTYLGKVEANPAFLSNVCHHWLAEDCEETHELELDAGEDIAVERLAWEAVPAAVHDGTLAHSLVVTALALIFDLRV